MHVSREAAGHSQPVRINGFDGLMIRSVMVIRSTVGARILMAGVGNPFQYDILLGDLSQGCLCLCTVVYFGKDISLPVGNLKKDARSQIGGKKVTR